MASHANFSGLLLGAAVLAAATSAEAQIQTRAGLLIPQISVMSDYRFDGVSNSDRKPSVQASLYLWRPDGLYGGGTLTHVRFNDGRGADVELVAYGGRNLDIDDTRLTVEAMAVLFPDQRHGAPTFNYGQITAKARQTWGPVSLGVAATWTPQASYHGGPAWKLYGDAGWAPAKWVSLDARLGAYESEHSQDRTFWNAGVTLKHDRLALDVRYGGTNLARAQCFYTDWCDDGLATKLTYTLPSPFH